MLFVLGGSRLNSFCARVRKKLNLLWMDYPDAFISIATSSQSSPLLAVHWQVTEPGDA
jgi:hypothetical protein